MSLWGQSEWTSQSCVGPGAEAARWHGALSRAVQIKRAVTRWAHIGLGTAGAPSSPGNEAGLLCPLQRRFTEISADYREKTYQLRE